MRTLLHALTNQAFDSATSEPPTPRRNSTSRGWRLLPVAFAFALALTLIAQTNHPTASAQTPNRGALSLTSPDSDPTVSGQWAIKFASPSDRATVASTAQVAGLRITRELTQTGWVIMSEQPGARVREVADIRAQLGAIPGVLVVEPVYLQFVTTTPQPTAESTAPGALASNDPSIWLQWGHFSVNATDAWEITRGAGVTVAVIDSGVDATHEDLAGQILSGYDFWSDDADPSDALGHGTHVAGTIAAARNNSVGGTGVAPEASILPVRVCGPLFNDGCPTTLQDEGIRWAVDNGADVINLSLGGVSSSQLVQDAIAYAIAHDVIVVASSGNSGIEQLNYPAAYPGVIGVGALTPGRDRAWFSTMGAHVDVVAPGVEVLSTIPGGYDFKEGTSMAAPHVAGVAALLRAASPGLTNAQVSARLTGTAVDLGTPGYDTSSGWGAVDAYRALTNGTNPDSDYFEIEVEHTYVGDLRVNVLRVGDAQRQLILPRISPAPVPPFGYTADDNVLIRYSVPDQGLAAVPGTWAVGVADAFPGDTGSIIGFQIRSNGITYTYAGPPVPIEDGTNTFATIGFVVLKADTELSALTISEGTLDPTFDPGTTAYTASVANDVESIDVTATTNDVDATLEIEEDAATSGNPVAVPLAVGENVIDIVVTAEDTFNDTTYTVTVTREAPTTDPDLSTVVAADLSVEANGVASTTVTVTLLDSLSNPLVGHDVTLGQDGSSTIVGGNTGTTDGSGQVAFTVTNITAETVTYDATDDTDAVPVVDTAEVEFTPIVSDPNNSTVDSTDLSVAANGVASTTVTVTLFDSLGDPVPSHDVTLSQGGGSSDISDGGLGTTDGSGQVSFTVTSTTTALVTYSAEDTTDTVSVIETADVDFVEPVTEADTSTVEAADPTVIADTVDETTITVTLLDSDGEPLEAHNVTLSQDGSSTIVGGNTGTTDGSGQVTFTVTSDTVEIVTYSANDDTDGTGVTQTAQVEFTPLPTDPDESAVVAGDATVPADGVSSTTITVTLEDELGAPLAGHNVSLDQDVGSSVISGSGVTDGSGQTVFSVTNTTQGVVTYTATDDTDSVTITQTAQVDFTEVPSDAGNSTVSAAAPTVLANGVGTTTVTVTLRNLLGNPVGGHSVTLGQNGSASISDGGTLVTDVDGQAIFEVSNTTVETVTFDATDTTSAVDVTQTAQVEFIEPTTDTSQSTVTAADPVVEADGVAFTSVTVTLLDADGAPLANHDVTLTQGAGSSTIEDGGVGVTNGAGQVSFEVSNATVEDVFYSATDDTDSVAVSQTAKVRFLITAEDASLSNLAISPGTLSPAFNPNSLDYSASVSNGTESTDVTLTTTQPGSALTVNGDAATSGVPVIIALDVGANPVEIIVTAPDGEAEATYTLTVNRAAPSLPPIFIPPPPPPQLRVDVTLTNDDGGTASVEDFTLLVDDLTELTSGESAILTFGGHVVSLTGPTAFYSVEFGGTCFEDGTVILLGGLSVCTVDLNDQPIAQVLSEALPDAAALIDESLSLTDDAFERDGTNYVEASSAGSPPEVTVAMPVDAIPGGGTITILVSPANELAIGQSPPPGALLIGGTGYVIQVLDGDGNPITNFALPLEISFLLPEGVGTVDAYYFDADLGIWLLEPGSTSDGRIVVTPTHLTTFGLFEIGPGGGLLGTPPSRGIWFTTAEGGSVLQLRRALLDTGAAGAFITYQGEWLGYLPGSPDFVNQRFRDFFGAGIPQGQVLLISIGN